MGDQAIDSVSWVAQSSELSKPECSSHSFALSDAQESLPLAELAMCLELPGMAAIRGRV